MFTKKCTHVCECLDTKGIWSNITFLHTKINKLENDKIRSLENEDRVQMEFLESLANQLGYKLLRMSHSGKTVVVKQK